MRDSGFQTSRDVVIGLADGAIITFAVTCGLFSARQPAELIINAGVVTAVAGAIVFGISRGSTEKTASREFFSSGNEDASAELAVKLGLGKEFQKSAKEEIAKDQDGWRKNIADQPAIPTSPSRTAFTIGAGFFFGAVLTFLAFLWHLPQQAMQISAIAFGLVLLISGVVKSRLAGRNLFAGAFIQIVTGAAAAGSSFFVGRLLA